MDGLFTAAKKRISPDLVRRYFDAPGSEARGDELITLNPTRADRRPGSFQVNLNTGIWTDFADNSGGNFIKLVSLAFGLSEVDAAKKILSDTGSDYTPITQAQPKPEKPQAAESIPLAAWPELSRHIEKDYFKNKYGSPTAGYKYIDVGGKAEYAQVRFEKITDGVREKTDLPFYYTIENKWRNGLPPYASTKKRLPLFNINLLTPETKTILLVEGCKCGSVKVDDILVISWGATSQFNVRRWLPLQGRKDIRIIIWPDKDMQPDKKTGRLMPKERQPGFKAALEIKNRYLPWAEILDVYTYDPDNRLPAKWDIADAREEDRDLQEIIDTCPRYKIQDISEEPKQKKESLEKIPAPFKFLGYDTEYHYFLPRAMPFPLRVSIKNMSSTSLMHLACLDWWQIEFPGAGQSPVAWLPATDWIIQQSQKAGRFRPDKIRAAGFWEDGGKYYCNTGDNLLTPDGKILEYYEVDSKFTYSESSVKAESVLPESGSPATIEEGTRLRLLFEAQGFESRLQAWEALGWSLMAPFGGLLKWRPSLWLTGGSGIGKSYLLENIILPLCCEFADKGSGENTFAGTKRIAGTDSRVEIFDEMEGGGNKTDQQRISNLVKMARNASSNTSNTISQAGAGTGVDTFRIFSTFLFASVVPAINGETIENRFFVPTLDTKIPVSQKKGLCAKILSTGVLDDPGKFMRRNFRDIGQILKNIEWIRKQLLPILHDQRACDNYAPIFAFIFALEHEGEITPEFWTGIEPMLVDISEVKKEKDEDILMRQILTSVIPAGGTEKKTIQELIMADIFDKDGESAIYNAYLSRVGIVFQKNKDSIAIAYNNQYLAELLSKTNYAMKYGDVLRRHSKAESKKLKVVSINGLNTCCVIFTFAAFQEIIGGVTREPGYLPQEVEF